jgi:transposase
LKAQAASRDDWWQFDQDECWFSRFAQPNLHAWSVKSDPLRLVERTPNYKETKKALACFGAVRQDTQHTYLYFCDGQPNSEHMWLFIIGLLALARQEKIRVVVMIWDRATWHQSKRLRKWLRSYNRAAKETGQPRLLTFLLPKKSPWLNPIEPRWMHAKRKTCEPDGDLSVSELKRRLSAHFDTEPFWNSQTI